MRVAPYQQAGIRITKFGRTGEAPANLPKDREKIMYVIIASMQIKQGHKEELVEALLEDAKASVSNEPGCSRFDVIQDAGDTNRVWLYEVYDDEAAFQAHLKTPHLNKLLETVKDWREEGPQGAARGKGCYGSMQGEP